MELGFWDKLAESKVRKWLNVHLVLVNPEKLTFLGSLNWEDLNCSGPVQITSTFR